MTYEEYYKKLQKTFSEMFPVDLEDVADYDFYELYKDKVEFKEACLEIMEHDSPSVVQELFPDW